MRNSEQLIVYVLYHENYTEGKGVYEYLYKLLCRDYSHPQEEGLGIPVYLRTGGNGKDILRIEFDKSKKNILLLLLDEYMCNDMKWYGYIDELMKQWENSKFLLFPIALCDYSMRFNENLSEKQFIKLKTFSIQGNKEEFEIHLYDDLIRYLKNNNQKTKIFISHTKCDPDKIGENAAKELKCYIQNNTKLNSFFDVNDILDGDDFKKIIESEIENSLFVIINTNVYSEREMCRFEVLTAKDKNIPMIQIDIVEGVVNRMFPYISNVPTIRLNYSQKNNKNNSEWKRVIVLILRTALKQYYENLYLKSLQNSLKIKEYKIISVTPDLYNVCKLGTSINSILYPEPPLGKCELDVLKLANDRLRLCTPMQMLTQGKKLSNIKIGISISYTEDMMELGIGEEMCNDIFIEIARHILAAGGKLVYGGDLRENGFTEILSELSYQYAVDKKTDFSVTYVENYLAWPIYNKIDQKKKNEYRYKGIKLIEVDPPQNVKLCSKNEFVCCNTIENCSLWAKSLSKMRREMEENISARIILGGKVSGFKGKYAGVYEETFNSLKARHPVYLLGGFGGAASNLVKLIRGKISKEEILEEARVDTTYKELYDKYEKDGSPIDYSCFDEIPKLWRNMDNGLNEEENKILFESTDIIKVISLILKGLSKKNHRIISKRNKCHFLSRLGLWKT